MSIISCELTPDTPILEYEQIARDNIDCHLGDIDPDPDDIFEEAYTLGFDALVDVGVNADVAQVVATMVAKCYAEV